MQFVLPALIAIALSVLLYAFVMFDRLVRMEYENERATWEADRRPCGVFWRVRECTWIASGWAFNRLMFLWLFRTPAWAARSQIGRGWLRRFRACVLSWNVLVVGFGILMAIVLS